MPFSVRISYPGSGGPQREAVRTVSRFTRITIGRASDCDIVLDDPKRHVSRVHAVITKRDGQYILTVVSKVNYVVVNGRQFAPDTSTTVRPGDRIEVGQYCLEVLSASAAQASAHAQTVKFSAKDRPALGKGMIASLAEEAQVAGPPADKVPASQAHSVPHKPEDELLRAFVEGTGMEGFEPAADSEQFMRQCGALLNGAVAGILQLLSERGEIKKAPPVEDNAIASAAHESNAIKVAADARDVLRCLIDHRAGDGPYPASVQKVREYLGPCTAKLKKLREKP